MRPTSTLACPNRGALLRPLKGDCRVFRSHGDIPRPPVQAARLEGGPADCRGGDGHAE